MNTPHAWDIGLLYSIGALHRPWLDVIAMTVTHLGDSVVLLGVVLIAAGSFLLLRVPRSAGIVVLVALLSSCLEWTTKSLVGRERPDVAWRVIPLPSDPSFPSGHALRAMAVYGCIGLLGARLASERWRKVLIASGIGLGILIGLTRPYLGVHYPLDVLAGWVAGVACALLGSALAGKDQSGS